MKNTTPTTTTPNRAQRRSAQPNTRKVLKITRLHSHGGGTFGDYELVGALGEVLATGRTCEPAGDPTAESGKNRPILPGRYRARLRHSPKFSPRTDGRKLPILSSEKCPESRCILIHAGNWPRDTSGCILVGEYFMRDGEDLSGVGASKKALLALLDALDDTTEFDVEIN